MTYATDLLLSSLFVLALYSIWEALNEGGKKGKGP